MADREKRPSASLPRLHAEAKSVRDWIAGSSHLGREYQEIHDSCNDIVERIEAISRYRQEHGLDTGISTEDSPDDGERDG